MKIRAAGAMALFLVHALQFFDVRVPCTAVDLSFCTPPMRPQIDRRADLLRPVELRDLETLHPSEYLALMERCVDLRCPLDAEEMPWS